MKKYLSLIKATMSEGMNLFRINIKRQSNFTKIVLPILITVILMSSIYSYSELLIEPLLPINMGFVVLTLFIIVTSFLTIIEGIYKASNLLFNCKDDNLLLSLPIKRNTVLAIRILKFYVFELAYNSLFILPAIICYAVHMNPSISYYISSIVGLLIFPIIPILISTVIGAFIAFASSKFKGKNMIQTILTMILLLGIMYLSFNFQNLIQDITNNASNINDFITKIYYPAGAYIDLIMNFNILKVLEFTVIHLCLLAFTILLVGKFFFNINSSAKSIKVGKSNKPYMIKTSKPLKALIKKEFNRFATSTVFITNAGFGMVLFVIGCILFVVKFDSITDMFAQGNQTITIDYIKSCIPIILYGYLCFACFMTSITSSMISLEGKSFNILKSLPVKPYTIIKAKVLAAILIMIPFILIGDLIIFFKFNFYILNIILILISSIIMPLLSEVIGIMVNLKYPKMDATNDTEVVKQSMSSGISVFIGMILVAITGFLLVTAVTSHISSTIILISFISAFMLITSILLIILGKTCNKSFNNISV